MSDTSANQPSQVAVEQEQKRIELAEEAKLKAKYPQVARPGPGFLQKRLTKGQKYFDSGDYNMAKAKGLGGPPKLRLPSSLSTNASNVPNAAGACAGAQLDLSGLGPEAAACLEASMEPISPPTGDCIPTPEIITHRKMSIHVQSKLVSSPQHD